MTQVTLNDCEIDFDAVVTSMDGELREQLHMSGEDWTEQSFTDAYVAAHREKFGEDFIVN